MNGNSPSSLTGREVEQPETTDGISRRDVLRSAAATPLLGGVIGYGFSRSASGSDGTRFVVEQGDECVPVEPLADRGDVVDLYGSGSGRDASNAKLRAPNASRLFLYEGPNGLSLVILQGGNADSGGAATFLVCGLPLDGRWVVLDDAGPDTFDEFLPLDQEAVLNWTWGDGDRTDGAVFRGLGREFCVTIKPAFNDRAVLSPSGTGTVESLQLLSGDAADPVVTDLDTHAPVTVRPGSCESPRYEKRCTMGTRVVDEPFDAEVTFCCTAVTVEADAYDRVYLNFLDGTDQRFDGPFEGLHPYVARRDKDGNPHDEVIRSVVIEHRSHSVEVKNPNFDRCRKIVKGDDADEEDGGY